MSSKCIKLSEKRIFVIAGFHYTCEHQLLHVANSIEKIQYSYILLSNSKQASSQELSFTLKLNLLQVQHVPAMNLHSRYKTPYINIKFLVSAFQRLVHSYKNTTTGRIYRIYFNLKSKSFSFLYMCLECARLSK